MRRGYGFLVSWGKLALFFMLIAVRMHVGLRQTPGSMDFMHMETIFRWTRDQSLQASGARGSWRGTNDTHGEVRE